MHSPTKMDYFPRYSWMCFVGMVKYCKSIIMHCEAFMKRIVLLVLKQCNLWSIWKTWIICIICSIIVISNTKPIFESCGLNNLFLPNFYFITNINRLLFDCIEYSNIISMNSRIRKLGLGIHLHSVFQKKSFFFFK